MRRRLTQASHTVAAYRVADRPYSRYPVGVGSLDRLAGVIHARQLVAAARVAPTAPIRESARATLVVPEAKDLGALLRKLREARQHLAIVVDESGGYAGIVTLEDILEELVGEIEDEFDLPEGTLERGGERTVRVAGSMTIDDFNEALGTDLDTSHGRPLAGLVFNGLGRRPQESDEVLGGRHAAAGRTARRPRNHAAGDSVEGDRWHAVAGSESRKTRDDESSGCR
jgi:putative hemolysin